MSVASAAGWGFRTSRSYPWESPRSWLSPGPHRIAGPSRCVNSTATGVIHGGGWPATGAVASAVAPGSPPCDPGAGAGADEAPACLVLSTRCAQSSARPSVRVGGWGAAPGQGERASDRPASWPSPRGFVSSCWTFPCKSVCEQRATSGATEGARPVQTLPVPWAPTLNTHEGAAPNTQVPSEPPYLLL